MTTLTDLASDLENVAAHFHEKSGEYITLMLAIRALRRPEVVPDGWQLVPKEPTDAMLTATLGCHRGLLYPQDFICGPKAMRRTEYRAMIAAAPSEKAS